MLATTLFLDFGAGIGMDNTLATTVGALRNIDGPGLGNLGTGTDLTLGASSPYTLSSPLNLSPLNYDFDGSGGAPNNDDIVALGNAVLPIVERALEPFDIVVQVASAANFAGVVAALDSNNGDGTGQFDAYSLVLTAISGGESVGDRLNLLGRAGRDDLVAQLGNRQDEVAMSFADNIFNSTVSAPNAAPVGTDEFNSSLVHRIAYTATHEAFHTFGLIHTFGPAFGTFSQLLMTDGDVIRNGATHTARENPFIVTRFDLPHESASPPNEPNNYLYTRNDPDIGLRDDDRNGVPDLAYVTGTGAFDKITLTRDATNRNLVHVVVAAHNNATFNSLIQEETYDIHLGVDTEGEILIDSSLSNDLIEIGADIAASVRIRGMVGADHVKLLGVGASELRSFVFDGEAGNDTFTIDFQNGDPLPLPGFNFEFAGGAGFDNTTVVEADGTPRTGYFVDKLTDGVDVEVGDGRADINSDPDVEETTLRAAVQEANLASSKTYVFLPSGTYPLTIGGSAGDTQGDLDISTFVTIIGSGAGETVIDAAGLGDRHFDIASGGALDVSRVTLGLGTAPTTGVERNGGAIRVNDGGHLDLGFSAIVGNMSQRSGDGGGIHFAAAASGSISNSVITVNESEHETGGVYLAPSAPGAGGTVRVSNSIIAKNIESGSGFPDVYAGTNRTFTSGGNNRLGNAATGFTHGLNGDLIGTADYIVSSVADTFDGSVDTTAMTVRDAIHLANNAGGADEIWLPGWHFVLRLSGMGDTEGDLDITSPISMLGIGAGSTIINAAGLAMRDRVLEVHQPGSLTLTRMTITGGETAMDGGGIRVNPNSAVARELSLYEVAVVGNTALAGVYPGTQIPTGHGGGIYVQDDAEVYVERSVITDNTAAGERGGGGIHAVGTLPDNVAKVVLNQSMVANNRATHANGFGPDLRSFGAEDPILESQFVSEGGNMITSVAGSSLATAGLQPSDRVDPNVDYVATSIIDSLFGDSRVLSLRKAVELANLANGTHTVWLPGWHFKLLDHGDIDIYNGFTIIVGAGAGSTIIDGSSLAVRDRIFETLSNGPLQLERMTLTGGETSLDGGAIRVNNNPDVGVRELTLREVAIVGNRATDAAGYGNGGGIYFAPGAEGRIEQSVITDNTADEVIAEGGGGGIYAGEPGAVVTLLDTVVALNTAALGPDLLSIQTAQFISEGGNMITNVAGSNLATSGLQSSDYTNQTAGFVAPNYVVTSLMDVSYREDDAWARSIRDAVFHTNGATDQTIWLPAWDYVLTQQRTAAANEVEMDSDQGDIDIKESTTIRGAGASGSGPTVGWRTGLPNDAIFDLLGDYNNDGETDYNMVSGIDYNIWQGSYGSTGANLPADGDDDGDVDDDDHEVWSSHFNHTLTLENVMA